MATTENTEIGIAHLSLLQLEPDELVRVAAAAGFDFVGVRVRGATPLETIADMQPGSAMSKAVIAALADTGIAVRDIEFIVLDGSVGREEWLPMIEAGAALGATSLSLAGQDPDRARLVDSLAELATAAAEFGIIPTLEPISYNAVATVAQAASIAREAGAAVMLDPLHIQRGGSSIADIADIEADLVPVVQVCDGPLEAPTNIEIDGPLPRGMTADGEPRKVEARALRLPPLAGELPLVELLRAVPAGVPVSVEVPNAQLLAELGVVGYATHLHAAATKLLQAAAA